MTDQANRQDIPVTVGSGNVFADLGFPNPEEEQLKARLAYHIMRAIKGRGLSQARAAKLLGVSQPNVSNLARGHYEDFSIDRLLRFLKSLGNDVKIVLEPAEPVALDVGEGRNGSQERGAEFSAEEAQAVAFHEQTCSDSASIWRDGLNILLRGFDPIQGRVIEQEHEMVLIALLMRAWQTIYRAYDNAIKGYYPQALNLLRTPIEDWMAYWYVRSFPEEYEHFTDQALRTPGFNDMLQKIEAKHSQVQPSRVVRDWIKRLHKYSHVDNASIQMAVPPRSTSVMLLLGPDQDAGAFQYCSAEGVALVLAHVEALDNLRKLLGSPGIREFASFRHRVDEYHQTLPL
jgi:predicted XRE-type DNA-binding protein